MKIKSLLALPTALLGLLSPLQAAGSSAAAASSDRMPDFSWDSVPLYVHVRKDTAFTDEEIKYLATFPLVTLRRLLGTRIQAR